MGKIFVPIRNLDDWRQLLAEPVKHWRVGFSAMSIATSWYNTKGFPSEVKKVFSQPDSPALFKAIKPLFIFPEYKVKIFGGLRSSQNDIFVLAKSGNELISIAVEGKVSENFGDTVIDWKRKRDEKTNKEKRLDFLLKELSLIGINVEQIRYQLLHRTASALLEARNFNARNALVLIHSFSSRDEHFDDYETFLSLFGLEAKKNSVSVPVSLNRINLFFAWIRGKTRDVSNF